VITAVELASKARFDSVDSGKRKRAIFCEGFGAVDGASPAHELHGQQTRAFARLAVLDDASNLAKRSAQASFDVTAVSRASA
jgi:hypothetical protein